MLILTMQNTAPVSRSGRFAEGPAAEVAAFTESISFDWRMWRQDIRGSKAHCAMLCRVKLLTNQEQSDIFNGLDAIAAEIQAGTFQWKTELEDVHMNIEAELTRRVPAGAKLHTGRSRNDQVALDLRLWLRDELDNLLPEMRELLRALLQMAEREKSVVIPGYTHMQRAQPVLFAHHMLAYMEMLSRDAQRMEGCRKRLNFCPLGSGALAGSTLPLDREFVAAELGFVDDAGEPQITRNSLDAVSDRDFALEFCGAAAIAAVHLSRLAEDMVLWASTEFGFIKIADAYTTGSSMMPQKKNPDVAELVRGKSARVIGDLVALLTLLKGLPMSYNRDLQEDKERLFDCVDTLRSCVRVMSGMVLNTTTNREACARAASDPALLATELADYLVLKGLPFRKAHHVVGQVVALAEKHGVRLNQLTVADLQRVDAQFGADALEAFNLSAALEKRRLPGSPGPAEVQKELARWKQSLA